LGTSSVGFFNMMTRFNHPKLVMTNSLLINSTFIVFTILCSFGCSNPTFESESPPPEKEDSPESAYKILILGDSLTEGFGIMEQEAYPFLLERLLNSDFSSNTGKTYQVINGGISGSTSSGGVSRIEWFVKAKPDFLILALGGNDGLRGVPVEETKNNLSMILRTAREKNIPTLLTGMKIPPNYGQVYTKKFSEIFPELAKKHKVPLIPFLLEGVGGVPEMNLPDRIHPNPEGHKVISKTIYSTLVDILHKNS